MSDTARALVRRKVLSDVFSKMSDEEQRILALLVMQDEDDSEIMAALQGASRQVEESKHSWMADFGANVAGNAVWDSAVWLLSRLTKLMK